MNAFEQDGALAKIRVSPMVMTSAMREAPSPTLLEMSARAHAPIVYTIQTALDRVSGWWERSRQRQRLADLDDHLLRDIGLTRADVELEYDKPFWRA